MKNSQKGFIVPVLLVIIALLVVGGGVYVYESKKTEAPIATSNTESQTSAQQQATNQSQQNNQPENIASGKSLAVCGNFAELSDFILSNIQQPDSQKVMEKNPYVITSFHWKRSAAEPFIAYPIINGVSAFYGDDKTNHSIDFTISTIKKDADALNQKLNTEAKNLGLSVNSLNTLPLQSFSNQDVTQVFAFKKGESLYSVVLTVDSGDHQAPPQGMVKITCGKALDNYDKVYSALNLKTDSSAKDPYNNDYVAIGDISSDNAVYAILGSSNQIKIADYYYFDGKTLRLVSKDSYPTQCAPLESQKIGKGMRCVDANYNQRTVAYSLTPSNNANTDEQKVLVVAREVITALAARDYQKLEGLVSLNGLSLNIYPQLDFQKNLIAKNDISEIPVDTKIYLWGYTDGKGDPINLTRAEFLTKWIYSNSVDYLKAPDVAVNKKLGGGNSVNTIGEDGRTYAAFYFSGFDPKYGGMDWTTLYLVFDFVNGEYKLRGIAKDNWTI